MERHVDQPGVVWPVICLAEMVTGRYRALGLNRPPDLGFHPDDRLVAGQNLSCKSA